MISEWNALHVFGEIFSALICKIDFGRMILYCAFFKFGESIENPIIKTDDSSYS